MFKQAVSRRRRYQRQPGNNLLLVQTAELPSVAPRQRWCIATSHLLVRLLTNKCEQGSHNASRCKKSTALAAERLEAASADVQAAHKTMQEAAGCSPAEVHVMQAARIGLNPTGVVLKRKRQPRDMPAIA